MTANFYDKLKRTYCKNNYNSYFHIMNNMKYSKYILNFDENKYAKKFDLNVENKVFANGVYVFTTKEYNEIVSIYDFVIQTLFTNEEKYLEV